MAKVSRLVVERLDGRRVRATLVRHVRTLTGGRRSDDVDLYRLASGEEIECISPDGDGRATPVECDPAADHYPGHRAGE
jgi:hypothetical protein